MNLQILRLMVEVDLKHAVSDALLTFENPTHDSALSFVSYAVQSHQASQSLHSVREQVDGFTPKVILEITLPENLRETLLAHLKNALPNAIIPYQLVPHIEEGLL